MISWSWQVYVYLWLAAMAGGGYFASSLADRFAGDTHRGMRVLSLYLGLPAAITGVMLLLVELEQPFRFWQLLLDFSLVKPMSVVTWIVLLWVGTGVDMIILSRTQPKLVTLDTRRSLQQFIDFLSELNLVFSALLMAYTGVLLSASNQPLWSATVLLPALFVVSATSTGAGGAVLLSLLSKTKAVSREAVARLSEAGAVLILLEMIVLVSFALWLGASNTAGQVGVLKLITTGPLATPFWAGIVAVALLVPAGAELFPWGRKAATKTAWAAAAMSTACVIFGGLILRAVIVIGGRF